MLTSLHPRVRLHPYTLVCAYILTPSRVLTTPSCVLAYILACAYTLACACLHPRVCLHLYGAGQCLASFLCAGAVCVCVCVCARVRTCAHLHGVAVSGLCEAEHLLTQHGPKGYSDVRPSMHSCCACIYMASTIYLALGLAITVYLALTRFGPTCVA